MERGSSSSGVVVARVEVEKEKHEIIDIPSRLTLAQMCASSVERRWGSLLLHIGDEQSLQAGAMCAQDCAWLGVDMDVTHAPLLIGWPSYFHA
jgi:hypothetical protein